MSKLTVFSSRHIDINKQGYVTTQYQIDEEYIKDIEEQFEPIEDDNDDNSDNEKPSAQSLLRFTPEVMDVIRRQNPHVEFEKWNNVNISEKNFQNLQVFKAPPSQFDFRDFFTPTCPLVCMYTIYYSLCRSLTMRTTSVKISEPPQNFMDSMLWGVHPDTEIVDADGELRSIKNIQIGEKLCHGQTVIGKIAFVPPRELYLYRSIICTGSTVVCDQGAWKPVYNCDYGHIIEPEDWDDYDEDYPEYMCNLIVTGHRYVSMGVEMRDFEIVDGKTVNKIARKYLKEQKTELE